MIPTSVLLYSAAEKDTCRHWHYFILEFIGLSIELRLYHLNSHYNGYLAFVRCSTQPVEERLWLQMASTVHRLLRDLG